MGYKEQADSFIGPALAVGSVAALVGGGMAIESAHRRMNGAKRKAQALLWGAHTALNGSRIAAVEIKRGAELVSQKAQAHLQNAEVLLGLAEGIRKSSEMYGVGNILRLDEEVLHDPTHPVHVVVFGDSRTLVNAGTHKKPDWQPGLAPALVHMLRSAGIEAVPHSYGKDGATTEDVLALLRSPETRQALVEAEGPLFLAFSTDGNSHMHKFMDDRRTPFVIAAPKVFTTKTYNSDFNDTTSAHSASVEGILEEVESIFTERMFNRHGGNDRLVYFTPSEFFGRVQPLPIPLLRGKDEYVVFKMRKMFKRAGKVVTGANVIGSDAAFQRFFQHHPEAHAYMTVIPRTFLGEEEDSDDTFHYNMKAQMKIAAKAAEVLAINSQGRSELISQRVRRMQSRREVTIVDAASRAA